MFIVYNKPNFEKLYVEISIRKCYRSINRVDHLQPINDTIVAC